MSTNPKNLAVTMQTTPTTSVTPSPQDALKQLTQQLSREVIGQPKLVQRLIMALLADGHLLVEGAPGLAKTRAIKSLSDCLEGSFQRVQFTPDLLPGDVTGTDIFRPQDGSFNFQPGPIFHNLVLADEINRAPAKVQSALLEAMAERQVSVGSQTYPLPELFLVMATQNPIEQEGTYPLPEAQLDRFLMHVVVGYPSREDEKLILRLVRGEASGEEKEQLPHITEQNILDARKSALTTHMSETVEDYIVALIDATRRPAAYDETLASYLEFGGSPRATIALDRCARVAAWLDGRDFVTPDDVRSIAHDCLRHRLILSFDAEAAGISADQVIDRLLDQVAAG
ncbi:MoxR-like ATPase [Sinobacterium caligoides]|uniref:MoxR-like ATPase n=2 Tax=Sinobacterium caligoides TaxID=933926 RepID=A0A3N2DYR9_9GAMM|nr:MoxR-like ATPase [Sinobacterium caligoides]